MAARQITKVLLLVVVPITMAKLVQGLFTISYDY